MISPYVSGHMFYLLEVVRGQLRWQKKIRKFGNLWRLWGTRDVKRGSTDVRDPQCENKKTCSFIDFNIAWQPIDSEQSNRLGKQIDMGDGWVGNAIQYSVKLSLKRWVRRVALFCGPRT